METVINKFDFSDLGHCLRNAGVKKGSRTSEMIATLNSVHKSDILDELVNVPGSLGVRLRDVVEHTCYWLFGKGIIDLPDSAHEVAIRYINNLWNGKPLGKISLTFPLAYSVGDYTKSSDYVIYTEPAELFFERVYEGDVLAVSPDGQRLFVDDDLYYLDAKSLTILIDQLDDDEKADWQTLEQKMVSGTQK